MISEAWYNVDDFVNSKKIIYSNTTQLEKAILDDDVDLVTLLFKKGFTIYTNGILCNGYYQSKYSAHPPKCHNFVCCRTAVYTGLWQNCKYYSRIFDLILSLCSTTEVDINIKNIYDLLIDVDCCEVLSNYCNFYDHITTNCQKIHEVFISIMPKLIEELERLYGEDIYENMLNDAFYIQCHKRNVGKNNENNCKLSEIVGELKYLWTKYLANHKVLLVLFSQQALEYYKYNITSKTYQLEQILDIIVSNPFVNINYICCEENIFSLTILQHNKVNMMSKIKNLGGVLPSSVNILSIITNCHIEIAKELIKISDQNFLDNTREGLTHGNIENLLMIVLTANNMMSSDKLEIFEIIMNRGFLDNLLGLIQLCLYDGKSFGLLELLNQRRNLIIKGGIPDVLLAIKLLKHKELAILLENNPKLTNEKYEGYPPIVHFFNKTARDGIEEILLLKVLLKHGCDMTVISSESNTPILHTIKAGRNDSFSLLFKAGADPFYYDIDGYNSFHRAILTNNLFVINTLKKCYRNNVCIINELTKDTKIHPLILAVDSANPIFITQTLLADEIVDYSYQYGGNGILHYVLKSSLKPKIKNILFKNLVAKEFDLLEQCKTDMKPLVVKAVELDLYEIVIMIMDKLLEKEEIAFDGYDNLRDIGKVLADSEQRNIIVKDTNGANFYSLVMLYLKNSKPHKENNVSIVNFFENIFIVFLHSIVLSVIKMKENKN